MYVESMWSLCGISGVYVELNVESHVDSKWNVAQCKIQAVAAAAPSSQVQT
jgi:hypothetical protein